MKRAFLYFSFFILSLPVVYAQSDTAKHGKKTKPAYKQGPSYIDANLYKAPRIQQDTAADSTALKKKLNLKSVDKSSFGPVNADCLPDPDLSIQGSPGVYFEKPHSVAWFEFTASTDTVLTFDIVPSEPSDDVDFLLFKDESGNFLSDLRAHKTKPVRSNIARCDKNLEGKTGLSYKGKHSYEALGKHNPYSTPLQVKRGEHFFLAVDNYTNAGRPFSLFLHLRWPAFAKPAPKPNVKPAPDSINLNIIVIDEAGKPVKTKLKLTLGVTTTRTHRNIDTANVSRFSEKYMHHKQYVKITSIAQGYLLNQSSFQMPESGTAFNDTIRMVAIKQHMNMVLQDIEFVSDEYVFLPQAMEPLSNLLEFMKSNPAVHILIKGYVNDPQQINSSRYDMDLSEHRAVAVKKYLMEHGIDESRMEWKGFGSNDMLYPDPKTWEEQQANRRVEIEVK